MTQKHALEIIAALDAHGVRVSVDGGWGVDALIGQQTRPHEDLDLVVSLQDVNTIKHALESFSYTVSEDHLPVRFVMRDKKGSQLDFHTATFDEQGGGTQQLPDGDSFLYPADGFVCGEIAGQPVRCISAEVQVLCHLGYEPTCKDANDVLLLCRHFNLAIPSVYRDWSPEGAA